MSGPGAYSNLNRSPHRLTGMDVDNRSRIEYMYFMWTTVGRPPMTSGPGRCEVPASAACWISAGKDTLRV